MSFLKQSIKNGKCVSTLRDDTHFPSNNTIESVTSMISNYASIFNSFIKNFIEKLEVFFYAK